MCGSLSIAICEDVPSERELLLSLARDWARGAGARVFLEAFASAEALVFHRAGGKDFDFLLLDIGMRGMSGMELLRRLRRASDVPVIMVTARDAVMDKVTGLDTGADDYITKPFEIEELLARIRAALRKRGGAAQGAEGLTCGALALDPARHTVAYNGAPIELTHREFTLLQRLMENQSIVLTRDQILEHVWGYDFMGETNVVDVYIRYLRAKIDDAFGVKLIHTVRGVGYVLRKPQ